MEVHRRENKLNKLAITTEPKNCYFDLTQDAGINLKH